MKLRVARLPAISLPNIALPWWLLTLCIAMAPAVGLGWSTTSSPSPAAFSGRATVVDATVGTSLVSVRTVISDTGPLPSSGGAEEATLLDASIPGLLTVEVLHASTVGQGNGARSEASVANLVLTAGGHSVSADFLMARAQAVCTPDGTVVSGSSEIVGLFIDGFPVTVTGKPNQTVELPLGAGEVVINEQSSSTGSDITVNALHVVVYGVANVVISSAHADVVCPSAPVCQGGDFVTGGGWITGTPSGERGTFAVAGGIKNGGFWGHLTFHDHGSGLKVKGTGVTAYKVGTTQTTRHIEGTCEANGAACTYSVDVADNGEPGRLDTFYISLSNGYSAGGTLAGGNIQLHEPCL